MTETLAPYRIRPANAYDWAAIAALHAASWSASYRGLMSDAFLDGPVLADRETVWQDRFTGPIAATQITVLAEPDGAAIEEGLLGFCCILAGEDPAWGSLVDNLHVRPGSSRLRLGRRLLLEATSRLLDGPWSAVPVHLTVLEGNARAIAAYESWGGTLVERPTKREPDGASHPLRRYGWTDPAALLSRLGAAP